MTEPASSRPPSTLPTLKPDLIPVELRGRRQWVAWSYEQRRRSWTKVPIQPRGAEPRAASTTNPLTWGAFQEALDYASTHGLDGVGYVFSPDDDLVGADLDGCRLHDGTLVPAAARIIERLDTYAEISPSKRGVKLILRGALPGTGRRKHVPHLGFKEVEVYDQGRFFALTGWVVDEPRPIAERQGALDELLDELFAEPEDEDREERRDAVQMSDDEILERARAAANGTKFEALWRGEWETLGYPSESEADAALLAMLAIPAR